MGFFDTFKKKRKNFWEKETPQKKTAVVSQTSEAPKHEVSPEKRQVRVDGNAYAILLSPHVSEKTAVQEAGNSYTFIVRPEANKLEIKQAVHDIYGVMPRSVRIITTPGKAVRMGRRMGRRSGVKKAIVSLPQGKSIGIHEGV